MAPEIPRDRLPREAPRTAAPVRYQNPQDPGFYGGGAWAAASLRASQGLADASGDRDAREELRAEEAAWNELTSRMSKEELRLKAELSKARGKNAIPAGDQAIIGWKKLQEELSKGEMTETLRSRLRTEMDLRGVALESWVEPYVGREKLVYESEVLDGALSAEEDVAISSADPIRAAFAIDNQSRMLQAHAEKAGKPREWLAQQQLARESRIHRGMIAGMIQGGRDQDASKYLEANRAGLTSEDLVSIEGTIKSGSTLGEAQRLSDQVFKETKGERESRDAIRALEKLDPKVRQLAEDLVEKRWYDENRYQAADYEKLKSDSVEAILNPKATGRIAMEVIGVERWDRLKSAEKIQLDRLFNQMRRRQEPDMNSGGWEAWTRWTGMSKADQAKMSDAEMNLNWRTVLSDEFYAAALKDRSQAKDTLEKSGPAHLSELGGWEASVRDALVMEGIDPKDNAERAARAELLMKTRIWAFEEEKKRKTTPQERQAIMKDALKEKVLQRTRSSMSKTMWHEKEVSRMDAMKRRTYRSIWGTTERDQDVQVAVPIEKIKEADRKELGNLLKGAGRSVTDEKLERLAGARAMDDLELFDLILQEPDRD